MAITKLMQLTPPLAVDNFSQQLMAFQQIPTNSSFRDAQAAQTFGTSVELSAKQRRTERAAARETRSLERQFAGLGKLAEFEDLVARNGAISTFGSVSNQMENNLDPIFDLLQSGQFAITGLVHEYIRTGSAWEAFKQAGVEFANAMPGIEVDGAERPSWNDVFLEHTDSKWGAAAAGLFLDIILDPVNLIPGAALAKGASRLGRAAVNESGAIGRAFKKGFLGPQFDVMGLGEIGEKALGIRAKRIAQTENELQALQDEMQTMFDLMTPEEGLLMGLWMDSGRLNVELRRAADAGIINPDDVEPLFKMSQDISTRFTKEFNVEVNTGLMDKRMFRDRYVHATEALDPRTQRSLQRIIDDRARLGSARTRGGGAGGEVLPSGRMGATHHRETESVAERLLATLTGDFNRTTELDIRNIVYKRSVDHIRWVNTKLFVDDIISDPLIARKAIMDGEILENAGRYAKEKKAIEDRLKQEGRDGYSIMEQTKTTLKDGVKSEQVVGAYIVPTPIKELVERGDAAYGNLGDVGEFALATDRLLSLWKGWATFGTGYVLRNFISAMNSNWLAGVGNESMSVVKGRWQLGESFMLKHLQAMKIQLAADGAARIPVGVKDTADFLSRNLGFGDFDSIPLPKVVNEEGVLLTNAQDIAKLGESVGVPMTATRVYDLPEGVERNLWESAEKSVSVGDLKESGLHELTQVALQLGQEEGVGRRAFEKLKTAVGGKNPLLRANHALAQMNENMARWALWIDRMEKGASPMAARSSTIQWHYDYRQLTDFERGVMRRMMPFYSWTRYNMPRMVMAMIENPAKFARLPDVKEAVESLSEGMRDLPTPDYYDEVQAFQIPLIHNDKPMFAQMDLPVMDLNRLNIKDVAASLHPMTKLFEVVPRGGYSFFLDAPIERFPGEKSEATGLRKIDESTLSTLFPPVGKVIRGIRATARDEGTEQAFSELTGIRMRALDVRRVMRANTFQKRQLAREYAQRLKQDGVMR